MCSLLVHDDRVAWKVISYEASKSFCRLELLGLFVLLGNNQSFFTRDGHMRKETEEGVEAQRTDIAKKIGKVNRQ